MIYQDDRDELLIAVAEGVRYLLWADGLGERDQKSSSLMDWRKSALARLRGALERIGARFG